MILSDSKAVKTLMRHSGRSVTVDHVEKEKGSEGDLNTTGLTNKLCTRHRENSLMEENPRLLREDGITNMGLSTC